MAHKRISYASWSELLITALEEALGPEKPPLDLELLETRNENIDKMFQPVPKRVSEQQLDCSCDPWRMHKVRCLPNDSVTSKTCQRCARTDRQCINTAQQKTKQQKRTDARVAESVREERNGRWREYIEPEYRALPF
jgi:hypothetical protein